MLEITPELKFQVEEVIRHSQNIENPQVSEHLRLWAQRKEQIAKEMLDGQLIYRHPEKVSFVLNDETREDRYRAFVEDISNTLSDEYEEFICYLDVLTSNEFYNNQTANNLEIYSGKKVKKGTKVIKSFKYFIADGDLLAYVQNKASMLIQEDKVEGYLCFSVHPLDFLSSSENTYNWRSCHSLDGDYRAGNLSYMMDGSTIVCYLESGETTVLPRFPLSVPWNNKKWRCLLHFDTKLNAAFAGRQYPFFSPTALDLIREILFEGPDLRRKELRWGDYAPIGYVYNTTWSKWCNDYIVSYQYKGEENSSMLFGRYAIMHYKFFDIYDMVKNTPGACNFNDLLQSSVYEDPYYIFKLQGCSSTPRFQIGEEVPCLLCGERGAVSGQGSMMCEHCDDDIDGELYRYCECCDSREYVEDIIWVDDEALCADCAQRESFVCPVCGEYHYNSNRRWDNNRNDFICRWCYEAEENLSKENSNG